MDRLENIHASLARTLVQARGEAAFEAPVTVAEIYQDLVPYRAVRTQLGFDMNADYEHTLLRLLAGEGDLARLDPPEARSELRAELGAANPNVGLFRKFAGCDVWIARPRAGMLEVDAPEPPARTVNGRDGDAWEERSALWMDPSAVPEGEPVREDDEAPAEEEGFELLLDDAVELAEPAEAELADPVAAVAEPGAVMPEDAGAPPAPPPSTTSEDAGLSTTVSPAGGSHAATAGSSACAFCDSALPHGRTIKYCPFCGADQAFVPCRSCGEALEPDWRYCIACGADAGESGAARA